MGSVIYLAMIPVSAYRYFAEERKATKLAKAQSGEGQAAEEPRGTLRKTKSSG